MDRVRLLDGKPLQEPPVLLPGEGAYFGSITRPLEAPVVEPLVKDHEPGLVKMEGLDPVRLPPTEEEERICEGIHVVGIADDRHQAVNRLAHVSSSGLSTYKDKPDYPHRIIIFIF